MKKWVIGLIAGVVVVAIVLAIGISHVIKHNEDNTGSGELATHYEVQYFESKQTKEQPLVVRAWAVGAEQFTKVTYQIDTETEVNVSNAKYDKVNEDWAKYDSDYDDMNYIDTGVLTIDLSQLEEGKHIFQIFVYSGSDVSECIFEKIFTIQ